MTRVLVVDDSKVDRLLIGGLLEENPEIAVEYAADGEEALEKLDATGPDLVVTDLVMPKMDGLELVAKLHELEPGLPIILVTSRGSEEVAVRALQAGATSYVPKSRLSTDLVETVERALELASERQEEREALASLVSSDVTYVLDNRRTLFPAVVGQIRTMLSQLGGYDESALMRIGTALEEALTNAAEHGNLGLDSELREHDPTAYLELGSIRRAKEPYRGRRVTLRAILKPEEARFVVRDEGEGFDPATLPDPTDPANLLKTSGRGVMLMRTFMDDVTFNDVGNEVTLVKKATVAT